MSSTNSDGEVIVTLPSYRPCEKENTPDTVCTTGEKRLSTMLLARVPAANTSTQIVHDPLTARFEDVPSTHDGESRFTVRFALSEPVDNSLTDIRDNALDVTGGTTTQIARIGTTNDAWSLSIDPDGTQDVQITVAPGLDCATPGVLCTSDGRALSNGIATNIEGPGESTPQATGLTARFGDLPEEHTGRKFKVHIVFSEALTDTKGVMMRAAVDVTGGRAMGSRRVDGSWAHRTVTVKPDGFGAVTVSLAPKSDCAAAGAICTDAGEPLTNLISARIQGPVTLSVADARVREAPGAALAFEVTMNREASGTVFVDYATFNGTARAGADYTAVRGRLRFAPGQTAKTVRVDVLDDSHDEGEETMRFRLSNANGAVIGDGEATGTIENSDAMPKAWLARFGRTVAEQVVDAAEVRLRAPPPASVAVRLAGQTIGGAAALDEDAQADAEAQANLESLSRWLRDENDDDRRRIGSREVTPREVLTGTSFALAAGTQDGGMAGPLGPGRGVPLQRATGRALARRRGDKRHAGCGLVAQVLGRWADGLARARRRRLPGGGQGHGREHADRSLPLRGPCGERAGDGVGRGRLRRRHADADAGRAGGHPDRHRSHDGGCGPARGAGEGPGDGRHRACGEDRRARGAHGLGGGKRRRRRERQPGGGAGRRDAAPARARGDLARAQPRERRADPAPGGGASP